MRKGICLIGLFSFVALLVAGCGGGGSSSSSSTNASTESNGGSQASNVSAKTAKYYANFTGGNVGAADQTKSPVTIGFMNNEGGVPSFPEGTVAAEAAVEFVNNHLGGVEGHPIELATCFVAGSEEQGQGCGQEFLSKQLPIVLESNGAVGGSALHQTINGQIPVLMANPDSISEATAKNGFGLDSGIFGTGPAYVAYAELINAKTVSLLYPGDDPVGQAAAKQIEGEFKAAGIEVKSSGYSTSSPDLQPNVIASGAGKTDLAIGLFVTPPACIAGAQGFERANVTTPILGLFLCLSEEVKEALGDFPKWTYVAEATNTAVKGEPATDGYLEVMGAYAPGGANVSGNAQGAFTGVLTAVRALNESGGASATPEEITATMKSFTGPLPMLPPDVKYGSIRGLPALPNLESRYYEYLGEGDWKEVNNGEWVNPIP